MNYIGDKIFSDCFKCGKKNCVSIEGMACSNCWSHFNSLGSVKRSNKAWATLGMVILGLSAIVLSFYLILISRSIPLGQ